MKLVFATHNKHKLEEVKTILSGIVEVVGLSDIGCFEDIVEDGTTLQENSLIKAKYINEKYGYNCFADDTGLEVDALGGQPGVYSARYAGEDGNSERNMEKLLHELEGVDNRLACFKTVITLIEDGNIQYFEGRVDGSIAREKSGQKGFGYDPIFIPEGYAKSFAEFTAEEKNSISHRGRAIQKLITFLSNK